MLKNLQGNDAFENIKYDLLSNIEPNEYDLRCPPSACVPKIPKANAWIVWLSDKNSKIIDLEVYEQDPNNDIRREKVFNYVERHLKNIPYRDTGCVISDWYEWRLADLLFKFGWQYGFATRKAMMRALDALSRIDEFEDEIKAWIKYV